MKERKSFIVGALAVLAVFWLMLISTFISNSIRGSFENGGIVNLVALILLTVGLGFAFFLFAKNKFEVDSAIVSIVAITAVVVFVLCVVSSVLGMANTISVNRDSIKNYKEQEALYAVDFSKYIQSAEKNISASVFSNIFLMLERLVPIALVVFSNEPKKTLEEIVGYFKSLFVKKPAAK